MALAETMTSSATHVSRLARAPAKVTAPVARAFEQDAIDMTIGNDAKVAQS
jgi:hypothetical protein